MAEGVRCMLMRGGTSKGAYFVADDLPGGRDERDDPDGSIGLRFTDVSTEDGRGLEKLVACLPDIESLEAGERGGLGSVISEILSRTPAE